MLRFCFLLLAAWNAGAAVNAWSAKWIAVPGEPPFDYGVYHFRKQITVAGKPASFVVHVTGDNRYQLFVNGARVVSGPARGDLFHWRYETIDIAPWLKPGENVLAAVVWNFAQYAPEAQISNQTGFLLQGDGVAEEAANTDQSWRCLRDEAYQPVPVSYQEVRGYFAAGAAERVQADKYPWGWEGAGFKDTSWKAALELTHGASRDSSDSPNRWMLVPRSIPLMEESQEAEPKVRRRDNTGYPTIAAHQKTRILFDEEYLTTGYPELTITGGRGATVSIAYAESLFDQNGQKGDRNKVEGKTLAGYHDVFLPDGGDRRLFRPLWWRTWRYLELTVETADQPLRVDSLHAVFTAYPFERKAKLETGSEELDKMLDVGWRTARLCAHETYMDCPYYEQLQYVGDTRIQALITLYMTGDGRLPRNAIEQIADSRTPEGATFSRFPSRLQQYIPGFSLWWIGMLHDYSRYVDDPDFVKRMLPGVQAVLSFFESHQKPGGSLGPLPWWNYLDWTKWEGGVPPSTPDGSSAPADLQVLLAYQWAVDLGLPYQPKGSELAATIQRLYWNSDRKLYSDTPGGQTFSQQTNILAILAGLVNGQDAQTLMDQILSDTSLTQCSLYFRHYLFTALNRVHEGDRYLPLLDPWRKMLQQGLTTWAETEDPTRSDCHAWSASPNYELFHTVLGIDSAAPGFHRVSIRPYLGTLTTASGEIPHPKGRIAVRLNLMDGKLNAEIDLPPDTPGDFIWKGQSHPLPPGNSRLTL
jgi:hypothetical protein